MDEDVRPNRVRVALMIYKSPRNLSAFQSLKGFWGFWNGEQPEAMLYLIFEVRLRGLNRE